MPTPSYPIKWEPVTWDQEKEKVYERNAQNYSIELDHVHWNGIRVPQKFLLFAEKLYNMEVRADDVWVVTFQKCGTNWTQVRTQIKAPFYFDLNWTSLKILYDKNIIWA